MIQFWNKKTLSMYKFEDGYSNDGSIDDSED